MLLRPCKMLQSYRTREHSVIYLLTLCVLFSSFVQPVVPGNAMPNAGLTDAQARDIAAYLYTLG